MYVRYLVVACVAMCLPAQTATSQTATRPPAARQPLASTQPLATQPVVASADPNSPTATWSIPDRNRVNEGTVTVITAPAGGATSVFGSDMARVLDDDASVRVLPVLGKGPVQNVIDVLYLKSIDMGVVTTDMPEFYKLQYRIPDIASKLRYIAKLYNNEIHVIARSSIKTIFDLEGKRIVAPTNVGYYSARVILSRLNIKPASFDNETDDASSVQKIADGEADAYIVSTGKIFQLARNIIKNEDRSLHLVPIPYDQRLHDLYLPATLSGEEYPNLLSPGQTIDTVATSVLLVSFNWPESSERYNKVARFVDAFFTKFDEFQKPPRHPKWKESSIAAAIPGWQRFKSADDWLTSHNVTTVSQTTEFELINFQQFLAQSGVSAGSDPAKREALFRQFQEWQRQNRAPR